MNKPLKQTNHLFPNGATTITFSRIYSTDKVPCKIRTTMPFQKFPVDPSDYRTEEHDCPTDMVATGIILDEDQETTTLICSPVYHEDQLDNQKCQQLKIPYAPHPQADWDHVFPYEASGKCPVGYMLTGVDYSFDQPYIHIRCCARKDIDQIIQENSITRRIIIVIVVVSVLLMISLFFFYRYNNKS